MFSDANATLPVKDLDEAKQFYGQTLGLGQGDEDPGGVTYKVGSSKIYVYPSEFAGTNQATYAGFTTNDVEGTVAALKEKGVTFEQYDNLPGTTREGDIHTMGEYKGAWFKDPSGNILVVGNM